MILACSIEKQTQVNQHNIVTMSLLGNSIRSYRSKNILELMSEEYERNELKTDRNTCSNPSRTEQFAD